jgi:hypothetical protein
MLETEDSWTPREARSRFSELFRRARSRGPQRIRARDGAGVVLISEEAFARLGGQGSGPEPAQEPGSRSGHPRERARAAFSAFSSGVGDLAERHDDYLAEALGEGSAP